MKGGEWVRPAGFLSDLWVPEGATYDEALPTKFEKFCEQYLKFPDGFKAQEPVRWSQWQLDRITRPILGLRWETSGRRVIRTAFFLSGRGNAKTTLASGLALFFLLGMGEPNPEVDLFAKSRPQATRMFRVVSRFVRASDHLDANCNVSQFLKQVLVPATGAELVVRSGDAESELGLNPSLAIVDELLSQPSRDLWDAVRTSFGKRPEGLLLSMTTPAIGPESFAEQEYQRAKQIQADRSLDPSYLPVIFEADKDDDVFSRKTWVKANPGLEDGFLDENQIRTEAEEARRDPTMLHSFKVYRCSLWPEAGHGFLNMDLWDASVQEMPDRKALAKLPAFMGIDMGTWDDLTSVCLLFWDADAEISYAVWKHWSTQPMFESLDKFTGGHWRTWTESPACELVIHRGKWVDSVEVADAVADLAAEFNILGVGLDSYRSREMMRLLGEEGYDLPIQPLNTSGKALQAATERVQKLVLAEQLAHNGDPVARWAASNAKVKYDNQLYPRVVKPDPGETRQKIDPVVALCFAADRWLFWERESQEAPLEAWLPPGLMSPEDEARLAEGAERERERERWRSEAEVRAWLPDTMG